MKEYMLLILNRIDHQAAWPAQRHSDFVKVCEAYIGDLQKNGHLVAAQPLTKTGATLSGTDNAWTVDPLKQTGEIQVGYYHIRAHNLNQAIELAKGNPEFRYSKTARIEVRPITEEESETGFVYPSSN